MFLDGVPRQTPKTARALSPGKDNSGRGRRLRRSSDCDGQGCNPTRFDPEATASAPPWRTATSHRIRIPWPIAAARLRADLVSARDGDVGLAAEDGEYRVLEQKQSIGLVGMGRRRMVSRYRSSKPSGSVSRRGVRPPDEIGTGFLVSFGQDPTERTLGLVGVRYPIWRIVPCPSAASRSATKRCVATAGGRT